MTDNIENLVLEHLRAIRADLGDVKELMARMESRMGSLELAVAGLRRDIAHMYGDIVEQNVRCDQFHGRLERRERRLELRDATA